jgi:phosphoglycolate phosphatase
MMVGRELALLPINLKADMEIQNILFDLDGTLINSSRGIKYSIEKAFSSVLPDFTFSEISTSLIGPPVSEMFKQMVGNSYLHLIDDLTQEFRNNYDSEGWKQTDIYAGVIETLVQLSLYNVKKFIVTNKPSQPTLRILDYFQMIDFFEEIVSPDTKNPSFTSKSAACQHLLTKYQLHEENTILIGDSRDDSYAAKTCGFTFVAALYGYGKVHEYEMLNQSFTISRFSDLMALIKN